MKAKMKPIGEQVIVLTGATSGIGLVVARQAASKGARLVLAARNEEALEQLTEEIKAKGGVELAQDKAPVSVTLIKPGAIDSPYKAHAGTTLVLRVKTATRVRARDRGHCHPLCDRT